jgi:energy-converting hydrogenase Eha subunit B
MATTRGSRPASWLQFVVWAVCGASAALILLAAFAFGPLAIIPTGAFAAIAVWFGGANVSAVGVAAGIGAWGVVLGWPRRAGAPWPIFVAGVLVVLVAVVLFGVLRSRMIRPTSA